ncbi:hypothetical protein JAAARDRAFT_217811 [Jaapia argillacea MUCL 33604]|uniref:Uncharacterized protein n=1 Tax=Jaapia argillacea MUCL 33604 TaxID=933084 RepID=A0A067QNE3_9AGAM|nr:hypothetical protein JAAARDRAFT_217811 [Jaapia argillacea MUCL 33604]
MNRHLFLISHRWVCIGHNGDQDYGVVHNGLSVDHIRMTSPLCIETMWRGIVCVCACFVTMVRAWEGENRTSGGVTLAVDSANSLGPARFLYSNHPRSQTYLLARRPPQSQTLSAHRRTRSPRLSTLPSPLLSLDSFAPPISRDTSVRSPSIPRVVHISRRRRAHPRQTHFESLGIYSCDCINTTSNSCLSFSHRHHRRLDC